MFFLLPFFLKGQDRFSIVYQASLEDNRVLRGYQLPRAAYDSLDILRVSRDLVAALHDDGYLLASIDRVKIHKQTAEVFVKVGERYHWAHLSPGNVDEATLSYIGYRERFYRQKPFQ